MRVLSAKITDLKSGVILFFKQNSMGSSSGLSNEVLIIVVAQRSKLEIRKKFCRSAQSAPHSGGSNLIPRFYQTFNFDLWQYCFPLNYDAA